MTVGVAAQLDLPDLDAFKWHFPKEFHAETTFDESKIYPQRAPDDGGAKRVIDNRWITGCAAPARHVHVRCLPPRSLGQVLAVLAAQVPLPPQRRGVQVLLEVPVHSTVPYRYAASKRPGDVGSFFVNLGDL